MLKGLIVILQMCIILMGKLLKWLLMVVYVCGVTEIIMFHYLLLFIRLLLWLAEGDGQQMVTDHDKSVNTGTLHNTHITKFNYIATDAFIACRAKLC